MYFRSLILLQKLKNAKLYAIKPICWKQVITYQCGDLCRFISFETQILLFTN